jgi:hypothetical protein
MPTNTTKHRTLVVGIFSADGAEQKTFTGTLAEIWRQLEAQPEAQAMPFCTERIGIDGVGYEYFTDDMRKVLPISFYENRVVGKTSNGRILRRLPIRRNMTNLIAYAEAIYKPLSGEATAHIRDKAPKKQPPKYATKALFQLGNMQ